MIIEILLIIMCLVFMKLGWRSNMKPKHKGIFKIMAITLVILLNMLFFSWVAVI